MNEDLNTCLVRACQGDEDAAVVIWNAYYDRLVRLTRKKLDSMPRRAADEEDVALSAIQSFLGGAKAGRLAPRDHDEMWRLLATIAVRKATAQLRKHYAEKRGGGQVRGDSAFDAMHVVGSDQGESLDTLAPHLGSACGELLASLDDELLRRIALMRLANYGNEEIAAEIGCSLATVKRRVNDIRKKWSAIP